MSENQIVEVTIGSLTFSTLLVSNFAGSHRAGSHGKTFSCLPVDELSRESHSWG
jgi:hypothetical protein